jgi:hypothetical protein
VLWSLQVHRQKDWVQIDVGGEYKGAAVLLWGYILYFRSDMSVLMGHPRPLMFGDLSTFLKFTAGAH